MTIMPCQPPLWGFFFALATTVMNEIHLARNMLIICNVHAA
jgi:hypothetical protein